jgi:hypothetical protein
MDFFTVPTLRFRVLYCFFVIEHGRREILHLNVTDHPTGRWIVQQLGEAFPEACRYRYAILDRDGKFGQEVSELLTASGMKARRISPACCSRGRARRRSRASTPPRRSHTVRCLPSSPEDFRGSQLRSSRVP